MSNRGPATRQLTVEEAWGKGGSVGGGADSWDEKHVKMPCSAMSRTGEGAAKWETAIVPALSGLSCGARRVAPESAGRELEEAVFAVNSAYRGRWDTTGLERFCAASPENRELLARVLPGVAALALRLPEVCPSGLRLLRSGEPGSVQLNRLQVASLLANAVFCTFPRRSEPLSSNSEYLSFPTINFSSLYASSAAPLCKLRFIWHYFERVLAEPESSLRSETVSVRRLVMLTKIDWATCTASLLPVTVRSAGTIEDDAPRHLHVDFANKKLGGGVLGRGSVQEEIAFLTHPELIITRLLCEELADNEAVIVSGYRRYSLYSGYSSTLEWAGNSVQSREEASAAELVAIDALNYSTMPSTDLQYSPKYMTRELDKAYCGLKHEGRPKPVATGHWGCGAFLGNKQLKAIQQIMAASAAGREVMYFTFGEEEFARNLRTVLSFLYAAKTTVAQLWSYLLDFREELRNPDPGASSECQPTLFRSIIRTINNSLPTPPDTP